MSSLEGLLLTGLGVFVLWTGAGVWHFSGSSTRGLVRCSLSTLRIPLLLALYTIAEMRLWAYGVFPLALLGWTLLILAALTLGGALLARRQVEAGWPLFGVGVSGLTSVALALGVNHFTSGDPLL